MTADLGRSIYPGRVFIAPAGADLADNSAFVDVGWTTGDSLTDPHTAAIDRPVSLGFDGGADGTGTAVAAYRDGDGRITVVPVGDHSPVGHVTAMDVQQRTSIHSIVDRMLEQYMVTRPGDTASGLITRDSLLRAVAAMPFTEYLGLQRRFGDHVPAGRTTEWSADLAGQARREYDQRTAPRSVPGADILDTIDAAVQELCACGCRQPLTPDGPSAFYASPECQRRFMEAQTTDPHDVYRRDDAAPYVGVDSAVWPLTETPTEHPETSGDAPDNYRITWSPGLVRLAEAAGNTHIDTSAPRSLEEFLDRAHPRIPWQCPDPSGVGYRRRCEHCADTVVPSVQDYLTTPCLTTPLGPDQPRWQQGMVCPTCQRHLPGPAVYADVQPRPDDPNVLMLHLSDGQGRTRRIVHLDRLARLSDPARAVALLWTDMESELEQFRRHWIGAARVSAMMAAPCVNPANPIRVTNC